MKKNRKTERANDENECENAETKTFKHVEQHDQSCFDILESKAVKKDRKTANANDENECENIETKIFFHVN